MSFHLSITILLIILLIAFIFYKITKKIVKTIFLSLIFILFLSIIFSYLIFQDFQNLKEIVTQKNSLLILSEDEKLLAVLKLNTTSKEMQEIPEEILQEVIFRYENNDLEYLIQDYYKIFIFDIKMLDDIKKTSITFVDKELNKEQVIKILKSNNPKQMLKESSLNVTDNLLKFNLFLTYIFDKENELNNSILLLDHYKKGNIIIYKETIIFKVIKNIPNVLIENQLKKTL